MVIEVYKLSKYYKSFQALDEISFTVPSGQVLGLLGPNGAGKTTCLRILTGYLFPSMGQCKINGYNIFTNSLEFKSSIGYLPENLPLYRELSVKNYLYFIARLRSLPRREESLEKEFERVLKMTQLIPYKDAKINQLSFGYRKRVGIAQALIANPKVLILDEPFTGLDPRQIVEMRNLIRLLAGNYTILLSSHILTEVAKTCDRVLIMHKGNIVGDLSSQKLKKDLEKEFLALTS